MADLIDERAKGTGKECGSGRWFLYGGDLVGGSHLEVTNQGLRSPRLHANFQPHLHAPQAPTLSIDKIFYRAFIAKGVYDISPRNSKRCDANCCTEREKVLDIIIS